MKQRKPFQFKNFIIHQENVSLPVTTDSCLFGSFAEFKDSSSILDLGTGTGLLMFILNQKYPVAEITGIELQKDSCLCASSNIQINQKNDQLRVIEGDLFDFDFKRKFPAIICNPPFFENSLVSKSKSEAIAKHFNHYTFKKLFNRIYSLLDDNGEVWLMLPYMSFETIKDELKPSKLYIIEHIIVKSKSNKTPHLCFVKLTACSKNKLAIKSEEIIVYNADHSYTEQSKKILSLIYLHLTS
jgi:tRNA1Val (adenine37-N6)-methyltransferase